MAWKSSKVSLFVWITASLICSSSAINVEEDGISVNRRNETYFSSIYVTYNQLCKYLRDDGMLDHLEWLQNGEVYFSAPQSQALSLLSINNFTLAHTGEYSCKGVLTDGTIAGPVSAGFVTVLDSSLINVPPKQYVLAGEDFFLHCSSSIPNTDIIWQHSGSPLAYVTNARVELELAGMYTFKCIIFHGTSTTNKDTEAIVVVPPSIISHSDTPLRINNDQSHFSLTAYFQSRIQESTTVTWQKLNSNEPLQVETSSFDDYGRGNTSLVFNTLSKADNGIYRVTVTNNHSLIPAGQRTASAEMELTVIVPPALPTGLSAASFNSTHHRLTWILAHQNSDEQASALHIVVQQPFIMVLQVPSASSEEFFVSVEPGTDYMVTLTASNDDGDVTTEPLSFTTDPSDPLISSAKAHRLNPTTLEILLELQYTGGGDIINITVTFNGITQEADTPYKLEKNLWRSVAINDQFAAVDYSSDLQFSVTNGRGLSRAMAVQQSFILPGPPNQPTLLPDSAAETSLTLQVELPTTGTVPIFTIAVEVTDRNDLVTTENYTGTFSHGQIVNVVVTDLSAAYQYTVVVYAVNAGGRGPNSDPATVNTGGINLPITLEALIGITVVGSVIITISLILSMICCVYCFRRCKGGEKYCTADYANRPNGRVLEAEETASKSSSYFGNSYPHLTREGAYTPRSPTLTSCSSSCVPPAGTEYSYEGSEADSVFPVLHRKQPDVYNRNQYPHFQYRHSPAPLPPISLQPEHPLSDSSTVLSPDPDYASPPATALSYATDV